MDWVIDKGGYFNPKQELGYDENGVYGVFAIEAIKKGEVLASFPWSCIIYSNYDRAFDSCELVALVAQEMHLNRSLYGSTLLDTAARNKNLLPTYWSKEGQELLLKVTGDGILAPKDPFLKNFEWKNECEWIDKDATQLIMTHAAENVGMVPLTDKYVSRGGNWTGAYYSLEDGEEVGLEIRAYRDIKKGEQIYTHYKEHLVGTPELLRDHGFVELYPQRYYFRSINVAFEVEETESGGLQIRWHKDPRASKEALPFLRKQLFRLKREYFHLQRIEEDSNTVIPDHELQVVLHFCRDYITALSLAVNALSKILGWTNTLQS